MKRFNQFAFDQLTDEAAYWIGFLITDGCIKDTDQSPRICLGLEFGDIEHVRQFKDFIGSSNKIYVRTFSQRNGHVSRNATISVRSKHMAKILGSYGVTPRKTLIAKARRGLHNNLHFWRGAIDGDGVVSIYRHGRTPNFRIAFCSASEKLIKQFYRFVRTNVPEFGGQILQRYASYWSLTLSGRSTIALAKVLYGCGGPALKRKEQVAHAMLRYALENRNIFVRGHARTGVADTAENREKVRTKLKRYFSIA